MTKKSLTGVLLIGALALSACGSSSEGSDSGAFPEDQVTITIAFGPGGTNDVLARRTSQHIEEPLGTTVAIENREGGGGAVGTTFVANEPDDGYSLVTWSPPGELLQNADGVVDYSPDDFVMLGAANVEPATIAVAENSDIQSFQGLIDKANSGERVTVAHVGENTGAGVVASYIMQEFDVEFEHVPYDGGSEVHAAVMGGHVDFGIRTGGWLDQHGNGVNIVAITAEDRIDEIPDVPTVGEETGTDIVFSAFRGLAVRSSTDPEIIDTLADAYEAAVTTDEFIDGFQQEIGRYEFLDRDGVAALAEEQTEIVNQVKGL